MMEQVSIFIAFMPPMTEQGSILFSWVCCLKPVLFVHIWLDCHAVTMNKCIYNAFGKGECGLTWIRISADNVQALQSVLNAGARLIMWKRKYEHITVTLCDDLHWLPLHQRIMYKRTIVYKCLHEAVPSYLTEMCVPVAVSTDRRYLRSAARGDLMVPKTRTITYGSQSLQSPDHVSGMICLRLCVHHPPHLDSSRADQTKDNTISLGPYAM